MAKVGEIYRTDKGRGKDWIRRYVFERKLKWRFKSLGLGKGLVSEPAYRIRVRRCDLKKPVQKNSVGYAVTVKIEEFDEVEFNKHHFLEE